MADPSIPRVITWPARHFLATWAVLFAIFSVLQGIAPPQDNASWTFFILTVGPFLSLVPLVKELLGSYGDAVIRVTLQGIVVCSYLGLDIVLWAVIRSGRRGAALRRQEGERPLRAGDRIDLALAWVVRYGFPLWASVTATLLFFGIGLDLEPGDEYPEDWRSLVLYGGLLLGLPLWPFLRAFGKVLEDPVIRAVVLTSFVMVCVVLDMLVKRYYRRRQSQRTSKRHSTEFVRHI